MTEAVTVVETGLAREDVAVFADVVGMPMKDWQVPAMRLESLVTCLLGPRQVGKSRNLAILATWWAFRRPNQVVLLVSAGEDTARHLLAAVRAIVQHPLLSAGVVDDGVNKVMLANGSTIVAVPQSERAIRGRTVDLLVLDESAYITDDVIEGAAMPTVTARAGAGARIVMACTASQASGLFYRYATMGEGGVDPQIRTFRWRLEQASTERGGWITPAWINMMRAQMTPYRWRTEYECEFIQGGAGLFDREALMAAVAPYPLIGPDRARGGSVVLGCDWGNRFDSHALVMLARLDDYEANDRPILYLPWLELSQRPYRDQTDWVAFIAKAQPRRNRLKAGWTVHENASTLWMPGSDRGYKCERVFSEANGTGAASTEALEALLPGHVMNRVVTTQQSKELAFSRLLDSLTARQIVLPDHPELLRQLTALESTATGNGGMRIAAAGNQHDDLPLALSFCALALDDDVTLGRASPANSADAPTEWFTTESGIKVPAVPCPTWGGFGDSGSYLRLHN